MPAFLIGFILLCLCVCLVAYSNKVGKSVLLKKKGVNIAIFVLSFITLVISLQLFWNIAIYVDNFNASPYAVYGGNFWLSMAWFRLVLLAILTFISGIKLFSK